VVHPARRSISDMTRLFFEMRVQSIRGDRDRYEQSTGHVVSGGLPTAASHRSGPAQPTHPTAQLMPSLPRRPAGVVLRPGRVSADRRRFPPIVHETVSVSLTRVARVGSPAQRYSGTVRLPDAHLTALRSLFWAVRWLPPIVILMTLRTQAGDRPGVGQPGLQPACDDGGGRVLPSSRGTLLTIRHVPRPRCDRNRSRGRRSQRIRHSPAANRNQGSPQLSEFRGSIAGILSGCRQFAGVVIAHQAKHASGRRSPLDRAGFEPARVPVERIPKSDDSSAFSEPPGARSVSAESPSRRSSDADSCGRQPAPPLQDAGFLLGIRPSLVS
jgi:hypothetical protein